MTPETKQLLLDNLASQNEVQEIHADFIHMSGEVNPDFNLWLNDMVDKAAITTEEWDFPNYEAYFRKTYNQVKEYMLNSCKEYANSRVDEVKAWRDYEQVLNIP